MARMTSIVATFMLAATLRAQTPAPVEPLNPATPASELLCAPCDAKPPTPPLPSYTGPFCERSTLTGDWLGCRSQARDCGFTIDAYSTQFYQGVASGGVGSGYQYGGRFDLLMNIDGEKAGLWKGFFVTLHDETLYGKNVNADTGALMPVSIGQTMPQFNGSVNALTGVQFNQFLSEQFGVFFGKLNTLDGFNQPFAGYRGVTGLMNMAFNFPIVAVRTIPYSTFGGGFVVLQDKQPVLTFMVLDTNNTPTTTGFPTFFDNGCSIVAIGNLPTSFFGKPGHQGLGGTYSNRQYTNLDDLPYIFIQSLRFNLPPAPRETGSWSVFYTFDQTLGTICCDPKRAWGLFGNAGISDGNPNPIRYSANAGVGGSVPICQPPARQLRHRLLLPWPQQQPEKLRPAATTFR